MSTDKYPKFDITKIDKIETKIEGLQELIIGPRTLILYRFGFSVNMSIHVILM